LSSQQPILMVEGLGGVRRAARVKPSLGHGEFFCSTRHEIFCFLFRMLTLLTPTWYSDCLTPVIPSLLHTLVPNGAI
jgi:hypothetical protein